MKLTYWTGVLAACLGLAEVGVAADAPAVNRAGNPAAATAAVAMATTNAAGAPIAFDQAPLAEVLRLLAEQAGINYVEPPFADDARVSLRFRGLTPRQAFERLAVMRGFRVYERDGVVTLRRSDLPSPGNLRIARYPLRHVDPMWVLQGVAGLLGIPITTPAQDVLPTYPRPAETFGGQGSSGSAGSSGAGGYGGGAGGAGSASGSSGSGSGAGSGAGSVGVARPRWTPGLPIETPIYVAPASGRPGTGGAELSSAVFIDRKDNALIVRASDEMHETVAEYVATLDKPERQILIDTRIVEVGASSALESGMDWTKSFRDQGLEFKLSPSGQSGASFADSPPLSSPATRFLVFPQAAIFTYPEISAVFRSLAEKGNVSMISQPRVVTRSGVPVFIQSTEEQSIETFQTGGTAAGVPQNPYNLQSGTEKFTTGVTLDVLPRLLDGGRIDLNVNPTVSSRVGQTKGASGQLLPVISRRSATTTVTVGSGMTVAIGGLMQAETRSGSDGIAPLNRIPVLGTTLFGRKNRSNKRSNLIIFVTPTVLEPEERVVAELPPGDEAVLEPVRDGAAVFRPGATPPK